MHTIAVLALDGVLAFDLSTPIEIFERACLLNGQPAYTVRLCGPSPEIQTGSFTLRLSEQLDALAEADTIIVPGRADPLLPVPGSVITALQQAAAQGKRIASICVGAFTLAAAGLLRGLRATTHWAAAAELARQYPDVQVDPAVLFVDNGQIVTSAGAAAGLDMCLHLVRRDYGNAVAAHTAKLAVMPLERDGGQAQFIVHQQGRPIGGTLDPLLRWMEEHADQPLTLRDLADHIHVSTRTLSRRFHTELGTTPLLWLNHIRLRQAQNLLETTSLSIEMIASRIGFGSLTAFRERFRKLVGVSPQAYRRTYRGQ